MSVNKLQLEDWPIGRLVEYDRNPRKNDGVVERMAGAIVEFGFRIPIVARSDGLVVDGHLRLKAARLLGLETVPVVLADELSEGQIKAFRLLANQSASWADWDEDLLSAELEQLAAEDFDLSLTGFDDGEIDRLLALVATEDEPEGSGSHPPVIVPEPPRNPASRTGDLWFLGEHRLLCGDSTSHDDVRRLMNGERAILFATDPPYLVDYDGSNHPTRNKQWSESYGTTWDDSSQGAELYDGFIAAAVAEAIEPNAAWYCWHASRRQAMLEECWIRAGAFVHQQIIWVKDRGVLTRSHYLWKHEPCLMGWVRPNRPPKVADETLPSTWELPSFHRDDRPDHPTPKPLDCFGIPMRQHVAPGRSLLRAVLGLGLADHGRRGERQAGLRHGDQPGLCRCRGRALAGRDRPRRGAGQRRPELRRAEGRAEAPFRGGRGLVGRQSGKTAHRGR